MDKEIMVICLLLAALCSPVLTGEWRASVVRNLDALVTSCVVVPCSFTHPGGNLPSSRLRGIWHLSSVRDKNIYHEDVSKVMDDFKLRTKLLGHLGQGNCTLEITDIRNHDNGPFCFRIELVRSDDNQPTADKFSFVEECVALNMLPDPPKPTLTDLNKVIEGQPCTITCSVFHTCPSHVPKLTWNLGDAGKVSETHKDVRFGNWETQSILTFVPEEKDDGTEITCTAAFHGQKTSFKSLTLHVKRRVNYNHIIIPTVVGIGTAVIFGLVCLFMAKKYKARIAELQSRDGSMWNRLSRLSRRNRADGPGPSRSAQRRSIWSRFSRRPKGDVVDVGYIPNNVNSKSCIDQKSSKPRFPSPKSQPKSYNYKEDLDEGDDYENTADLNVYGNL